MICFDRAVTTMLVYNAKFYFWSWVYIVVLQFTWYHFRGLIYWLIDCLIKWSLYSWLTNINVIKLLRTKWLITSGLIDWQTDWLTFWQTDSLTDKMAHWLLNEWLINWLVVDCWPTDLLADLLTEWLTIVLPEWMTCWPADRLTYWLTDWLTDWLTNWWINWLIDWLTYLEMADLL